MKLLKDKGTLLGIGIIFLLLVFIGLSYAWFSATIKPNNVKDQVVTTGTLELTYIDGPEIRLEGSKPGTTLTKEIEVKNTGTLDTSYNLVWQELYNEIINDEMVMSVTCEIVGTGEQCEGLNETPIGKNIIIKNTSIESKQTHKYVVTITFKETNSDQNYNQGKNFTGTLGVNEYREITPVYCTYDGNLTQGAEFTNGSYTYRYMQQYLSSSEMDDSEVSSNNMNYKASPMGSVIIYDWANMTADGWGVHVKDEENTDAITDAPCTYINNKPVVSMSYMFYNSQAKTIDLSMADTSNVKNMHAMFVDSAVENIKGFEMIDTSNVTDMSSMFMGTYNLKSIDLSGVNTSNVIYMYSMFSNTRLPKVDVSNFNTSNVTNMDSMFMSNAIEEIKGLNKFNTSKVTDMGSMFGYSLALKLDVSSFDTSNVIDMDCMFYYSKTNEIIGLDKFNTSKVTNMGWMFWSAEANEIDVSNFNTSNVTDMNKMFSDTKVTSLNLLSFDTSKVTNMREMFKNTNVSILDLSSFDFITDVSTSDMFYGTKATIGYVKNQTYLDKITFNWVRVNGLPDTLKFSVKQ